MATAVVCASVIADASDRILLVREAKASALGRWSLPGGRLERGESLEACAAREVHEETGLRVDVGPLLGIFHCPATLEGDAAVIFVFRSVVVGGSLATSTEHPEIAWLDRSEVADLVAARRVRGQHVALAVAALDAGSSVPAGLVTEVGASPRPRENP